MKLSGVNNLIKFQERKIYSIFEGWLNYAELHFIILTRFGVFFPSSTQLLSSVPFFQRKCVCFFILRGVFIIVTDDEISDRLRSQLCATRWRGKLSQWVIFAKLDCTDFATAAAAAGSTCTTWPRSGMVGVQSHCMQLPLPELDGTLRLASIPAWRCTRGDGFLPAP